MTVQLQLSGTGMESLTSSFYGFPGGNSLTNSTEDFFNKSSDDPQSVLEKLQSGGSSGGLIDLENFLKNDSANSMPSAMNRQGLVLSGIKQETAWEIVEATSEAPQPLSVPASSALSIPSYPTSNAQYAVLPIGEKQEAMVTLEQLLNMIDSGNQLNMNALVALNFNHEGKPFGLKLSVMLQLLLHQAAYAFWMGKKSAPTASRNCKFEGAHKGQTKYPKRKFCGWVNKLAELTKSYGADDLCSALQELWSLLRLSPSDMDCRQNDSVKKVISEFFRIHQMLLTPTTPPTITEFWAKTLVNASKPEVFMKRTEGTKTKKQPKSQSPSPPDAILQDAYSQPVKKQRIGAAIPQQHIPPAYYIPNYQVAPTTTVTIPLLNVAVSNNNNRKRPL